MNNKRTSLKERFLQKIRNDDNGCWIWTGRIKENGYGEINPGGRSSPVYAHRVSYELFKGQIPEGMYVLHKCDVRECVNPDHLFLGTAEDNTADMMRKGRGKYIARKGEDCYQAELTEENVHEIRHRYANGETKASIAKDFNVCAKHIYNVATKRSWKWLD
jgi:hypothetical protein